MLLLQIYEEAKKFAYQSGVKVAVVYGGAPMTQQVCVSFPVILWGFKCCISSLDYALFVVCCSVLVVELGMC